MPDGTAIQLEDWDGDFMIGAYPYSKGRSYFVDYGERFRLSLSKFTDNEEAQQTFESLIAGTESLENLREHYWNPVRDSYLMGIISTEDYEEYKKLRP
jgi:hypothetical protein